MVARRVVLETDEDGRPKALPRLPPLSRVEAVFTVLDDQAGATRTPPAELAELRILGDIVSPGICEDEWKLNDP
jgi:hypothetical protein